MIDTDKYEGHTKGPWDELLSAGVEDQKGWDTLLELGFNDEARQLIADAPLLLAEVKRMQYWDEEMDRVIAHLAQHNWASSDGDVHEIVEYTLAEVERLRSIADDLYAYIVSDADISLSVIEEQMDWREEE